MSVSIRPFGTTSDGTPVQRAILQNDLIEVHILSYGGIIASIRLPGRRNEVVDVVLGYPAVPDYEVNAGDAMGAVVGRYANRIGGAAFTLDGRQYRLTANENGNTLHSGLHGLQRTVFTMALAPDGDDGVVLTAVSPAGVDGFPGRVEVEVEYRLVDAGLMLRYQASTDAPTVCSLTNHSYFNLDGHANGSVLGHRLTLASDEYLETDTHSIPTGARVPVAGTPMDFNVEKTLGRDIGVPYPALVQAGGYDHCYLIRDSGLRHAAWLEGPRTGIRMEVLTTLPAVQLYTANFLAPATPGKDGAAYARYSGVCLETQELPDAPNHPDFPDTTLRPDRPYSATTVYRFELPAQPEQE